MRASSFLTTVLVAAIVLLARYASAYPRFVSRVPNADAVTGVQAIGHRSTSGGGALNAFGEAFEAQNTQWTAALCHADSDGDGATNGEELGDPCCQWSAGAFSSDGQHLSSQVSHPGVPNMWTQQQLAGMKCQEAFSPETSAASGATAAAVTTPTPAVAPDTAASSLDGDGDELPSTIDPAGLTETPPSLMPQSPAPASQPVVPKSSPTPTPSSDAGQRILSSAFGVVAIALFAAAGVIAL